MGTTLSLVAITATLFNVKLGFAECKCDRTPPDADFDALEHDPLKCTQWPAEYQCKWNEECQCRSVTADHDKSECSAQDAADSCHWVVAWREVQMHGICPDHCVMTAHWAVAVNLDKVNPEDWTPDIWNTRAETIDEPFKKIEDIKVHAHGTYGSVKYGKWSRKETGTFKEWEKQSGGGFIAAFAQMMLETVGLNYGQYVGTGDDITPTKEYPHYYYKKDRTKHTKYDHRALQITRRLDPKEHRTSWNKERFYDLLTGRAKFLNSRNEIVTMRALIMGVQTRPFVEMTTSMPYFNHEVAVVPLNGHWYYLDSNVPAIQTLEVNDDGTIKDIPLISTYSKPGAADVEYTNVKGESPEHGGDYGYLVDPSIDLGSDLNVVAQWLYEKCSRPYKYTGEGVPSLPADSGGAYLWRVIVDDEPAKNWDAIKDRYKNMIEWNEVKHSLLKSKKDLDWTKAVAAQERTLRDFKSYQIREWAHVGYEEHNNLHWNKGNDEDEEEEEYDTDRESVYVSMYGDKILFLLFAGLFVCCCTVCVVVAVSCFEFGKYRQKQDNNTGARKYRVVEQV